MRAMICARREIVDWLDIASELVCDYTARVAKLGDKPLQETSRGFRVSLWLNENVEHRSVRVDRPPHYDTFAEFQYSYHYGDSYIPHINHSEPLKVQCQHFLDCINKGTRPMTCGRRGLELVRILEETA